VSALRLRWPIKVTKAFCKIGSLLDCMEFMISVLRGELHQAEPFMQRTRVGRFILSRNRRPVHHAHIHGLKDAYSIFIVFGCAVTVFACLKILGEGQRVPSSA